MDKPVDEPIDKFTIRNIIKTEYTSLADELFKKLFKFKQLLPSTSLASSTDDEIKHEIKNAYEALQKNTLINKWRIEYFFNENVITAYLMIKYIAALANAVVKD